ncbi:T9SS type A sorting domain-containing protein [Aurantibacillus circumpalustris]|uniref:T9SS type A sorting domain-containing protein n=1 Tax=Aurantibacillus circumpalustris TaxID=3036359 RepID=UPI00295A8117|nr:T9SS type A sorting domain-containing protein [Aurantibacillus circumpalustris]
MKHLNIYSLLIGRLNLRTRKYFVFLGLCLGLNSMIAQQTYTFTNAGATGRFGPSQTQINSAYLSTSLNGSVVATAGIQSFTVSGGVYRITAYGAQGGNSGSYVGGLGAKMQGDFILSAGAVIKVLVGQQGEILTNYNTGGGGASFVWVNGQALPLVVAGGGGGTGYSAGGVNASTTTAGTAGTGVSGVAGINGNGANPGGGGWLSDGINFQGASCAAKCSGNVAGLTVGGASPTTTILYHGCAGTSSTGDGGFGGGSGANGNCTTSYGGGGGGGYSGGVGQSGSSAGGGGGGSYNGGTSQVNTAAANSGHGKVVIEELCNISLSSLTSSSINAICNGNSATLTTNAVSNYSWSTGASSSSVVVSPTTTTVYTLGATSASNCTAYAAITITVNGSLPVLTVANTASSSGGICPTQTVMLTASGALVHNWAGGAIPVTNGVVFSPTSAVSYTVSGVNGCGTTTAVTSVSVHPFPTVNPATSSSTLCAGGSVTLTATGNATNYAWSGGSGPITNGVGFAPAITATYVVIGTSALSCTAFATMPVTVYPTPINAPTANPNLICIGGSSTLSATGALSYTWASTTQTVNTSDFTVTPSIGITTYTITKANSSCVNTQVLSLQTNPLPTVFAIVTPTVVCALTPATLAIGGALTYTWTSPGPPTYTFTGSSPIVSPIAPSVYSVAASDGTCISTTTVFLNANPNPTITVSASTPTLCEGQTVNLNATGGINYNWTATGGGVFTGASIADTPTTATAYNVTGDNSFGCTSGASQVVLVYAKPNLTVTSNKALICSGGGATLTALGASTYSWDANANNVLTAIAVVNPIALTSSAIMYTVEGTNSSTGCKNTQTVAVSVFIPTLTISGSTNTCSGGLINLNGGNGVLGTYNWHTGSGTPITNQILQIPLTVASVFTLTANSNSVGLICPATQTIALGIYYNPTITAVPARTLICVKESVEITAAGGSSYAWDNTMTGPTITVSPNGTAANYTVTGTDDNGCSSTATVQVKISSCAGLNELSHLNSEISIYPNPNDGKFTIQTNADLKLSLVNELGQLIRVINLSAINNHEVNISDLAKGIYFVSGRKDSSQIYQKIVVIK